MSATINDLKFVIFGSGHDYTLLNSGRGDIEFFSHPSVPLGSVNGASQYYFEVPNANGEFFDAVKDDIEHCTFTPAIGSTFNTAGNVEVKVRYYREYVYEEETVVVEKELSQAISVVDHGTIVKSKTKCDIYSDGYCFWRVKNDDHIYYDDYYSFAYGEGTKSSCIPWRAISLHSLFLPSRSSSELVDISELAYADTSRVTDMSSMFEYCDKLMDLSALKNWDTSNLENLISAFSYMKIESVDFLENWDVSSVIYMQQIFEMTPLKSVEGLHKWNPHPETIYWAFLGTKLESLRGLENIDTSNVTSMEQLFCMYSDYPTYKNLDPLKNWDVSNVETFSGMFSGAIWLKDISGLSNWRAKQNADASYMFSGNAWVLSLEEIENFIDESTASNISAMFYGGKPCHSSTLNLDLIEEYYGRYRDIEGNIYNLSQVGTLTYYDKDASAVSGWNIDMGYLTLEDIFDDNWINLPDWT